MLGLKQILDRVPLTLNIEQAERLSGGSVNEVWKVPGEAGPCVVRLDGPLAAELRLDRGREEQVLLQAASAGIGPEVIWTDRAAGLFVTGFLEGRRLRSEDFEDSAILAAVATRVQELHALPVPGNIPPVDYAKTALEMAELVATPGARRLALQAAGIASDWCLDRARYVLCHNDLSPANCILTTDGPMRFVDWEYAAPGEPCFDLASLAQQAELNEHTVGILLASCNAAGQRARFDACRDLYDRLAALWLIVVCERSAAPAGYKAALAALQTRLRL
jgi:thiamine kinase-like enzyme